MKVLANGGILGVEMDNKNKLTKISPVKKNEIETGIYRGRKSQSERERSKKKFKEKRRGRI